MATTSAGSSMAGYLWQATEACRRSLTAPEDSVVKIEVEDDLSVATMDGTIQSCEQLKHSQTDSAISEESPLWWQALDAWIRGPAPREAQLKLLTTNALKPDSLLAACYRPTDAAPWDELLDAMDQRAKDAPNKVLREKGVYRRWIQLEDGRRQLLTRIQIASSQRRLEATSEQLEEALIIRGVPPINVARVRNSFVGAFMTRLTKSLDSGGFQVTIREMNADFLDAYARHAMPGEYEFPELQYTDDDIRTLQDEHHQHLIPQLAAIGRDQPETVACALDNWFRARTRRQDFMDGAPHEIEDLKKHDKNLTRYCQTVHEEHLPVRDPNHATNIGRHVHASCMQYQSRLGRTPPPLDFSQGSYHELSNSLHLRWNPSYGEDT